MVVISAMTELPNIFNSQLVIEIEQNPSIRKRVFEFEEKLDNYFKTPFRVINVPDNIDPTIPRFESNSTHGHSLLQVSGTRLVMKTNYEDNFQGDTEKINEYIAERASIFNELLKPEKKLFIAYILELAYDLSLKEINGIFKEQSGINAINKDTIDISLLYSMPFADKYYINIKSSKFVSASIKVQNNSIIKTDKDRLGISVNLDINSKLNLNKGNGFDEKIVGDISNLIFRLIKSNNLTNYLSGNIKNE